MVVHFHDAQTFPRELHCVVEVLQTYALLYEVIVFGGERRHVVFNGNACLQLALFLHHLQLFVVCPHVEQSRVGGCGVVRAHLLTVFHHADGEVVLKTFGKTVLQCGHSDIMIFRFRLCGCRADTHNKHCSGDDFIYHLLAF